jgi:hypothetical protein
LDLDGLFIEYVSILFFFRTLSARAKLKLVPNIHREIDGAAPPATSSSRLDGFEFIGEFDPDATSNNLSSAHGSLQSSPSRQHLQHEDWPSQFSLDVKQGYCNQLIGLSGESDPFVLRHYQYNVHDTHPMHRLSFRKMGDDGRSRAQNGSSPVVEDLHSPSSYPPVQFVLTDDDLCQNDLKGMAEMLSGGTTEEDDAASLRKLIPVELGARLLDL